MHTAGGSKTNSDGKAKQDTDSVEAPKLKPTKQQLPQQQNVSTVCDSDCITT
jgi:hypothetical protein